MKYLDIKYHKQNEFLSENQTNFFRYLLGIFGYFWVFYYLGENYGIFGYFIIAAWVFFNYAGNILSANLPGYRQTGTDRLRRSVHTFLERLLVWSW